MNRKKKYLKIFLFLILAGLAGTAFLVYSSGILADDNPRIPQQMITRINLERQANNLAPVRMDDRLANLALATSREVKVSSLTYSKGTEAGQWRYHQRLRHPEDLLGDLGIRCPAADVRCAREH